MDQLFEFLDFLRNLPAWLVVAFLVAIVALSGWWLRKKLFGGASFGGGPPLPFAAARTDPTMEGSPSADMNSGSEQEPDPESSDFSISATLAPLSAEPDSPAVAGFRAALESRSVPAEQRESMVRDYVSQLNDVGLRLAEIAAASANDKAIPEALADIRAAIESGRINDMLGGLDALGSSCAARGREARIAAEQDLTAAALARLIAGDMALAVRDPVEAEKQYRLAIEALPSGADALLAECLNKHGTAAYRADALDIAAMSFRRAVKLLERLKGPEDPDVATALNNLAMLYYARGDLTAAEPLYRRALAVDESVSGKDSTAVATDLNNLGLLLKQQKRLDEAEPLLKRALEIKEQQLESGHPSLITGLRNYATVLKLMGRDEDAAPIDRRVTALLGQDGSARVAG